jgi:hypothetical protein
MGRQARRDVETHYALNRLPGILSRFYEEVMS